MPTRAFAEIRAARHSQHSRNPFHAGPVFRGFTGSPLLRPVRLLAPLDGSDQGSLATGDFYIQASGGSVALPAAGYDYNSTGLLCWRDFHPQEWQLASLHQNPHALLTSLDRATHRLCRGGAAVKNLAQRSSFCAKGSVPPHRGTEQLTGKLFPA